MQKRKCISLFLDYRGFAFHSISAGNCYYCVEVESLEIWVIVKNLFFQDFITYINTNYNI